MYDPKKINVLRQRKADCRGQADQILQTAERELRQLTVSERAGFDALTADLKKTEAEIIAWEREAEKERAQGVFDPQTGERIPEESPTGHGRSGRRYAELFGAAGGRGGFKDYDDFLRAVTTHTGDPRLQVALFAAGGEKFPSEGGFFVPTEFAADMLDRSLETEIVRPRADVHPMISQTKKIAGVDVSSPSSSFGAEAEWIGESGSATARTLKVRAINLVARKLALYAAASNELVADGVSYEEQLSEALIMGLGYGLDLAFLSGDGAGRPLGVLNDPSLIVVSKETGQLASTIVYENLTKMFARLHPASFRTAVWVANSSAIPQLLQVTLAVGTAGVHFPVLRESDGKFFIFTKEVIFTEKLPALGTKGDIILADFSQYAIGLRKEVSVDKSIHLGWLKDESNYRSILRADGQGRWAKAYTPKNGDSLSWCVTLATRS